MDLKKVRDSLGRAKSAYQKKDILAMLNHIITGLQEVLTQHGANLPTDIRGALREVIQLAYKEDEVKQHLSSIIVYNPGMERAILAQLNDVIKSIKKSAAQEERDLRRQRKQMLDKNLLLGQKLLEAGKASEADASFQEALKYYRDEHRVFVFVAKHFLAANQPRRALGYARMGVKVDAENPAMKEVMQQLSQSLSSPEK